MTQKGFQRNLELFWFPINLLETWEFGEGPSVLEGGGVCLLPLQVFAIIEANPSLSKNPHPSGFSDRPTALAVEHLIDAVRRDSTRYNGVHT